MGSELVPENARSLIVGWGKKFLMHHSGYQLKNKSDMRQEVIESELVMRVA